MIVDANVLLYAVDDQSHFHTTARTWLTAREAANPRTRPAPAGHPPGDAHDVSSSGPPHLRQAITATAQSDQANRIERGHRYVTSHRPAPAFVEWLIGLPAGWVTDADDLTQNQQITALGNGVLPLQAVSALASLD